MNSEGTLNYFVYMTLNIINYKWYIGITSKPISSGYIGSGTYMSHAIRKYGGKFFIRHDVFQGTREEASEMEKQLIKFYSASTDKDFYNLREGGFDGPHGEESKKKISDGVKRCWKNPVYIKKVKAGMNLRDNNKLREVIKRKTEMGLRSGEHNGMFRMHHTDKAKEKISISKNGVKMNLSEEQKQQRAKQIKNIPAMIGPKSNKHKARVRWGALKKSFSKDPIIHQDIKMMHDNYEFHEAMKKLPKELLLEYLKFRFKFLQEEINEGTKAIEEENAEEVCDSLIDLIVVAIGTLDMYQIDFKKAWYEVLTANMQKRVGVKESRPNPWGLPDLIKPENWQAPVHAGNHGLIGQIFEKTND